MKELIYQIKKEGEQFNLEMQQGATSIDITILVSKTFDKFSYEIPEEYLDLLREMDGIFYNGIEVYATTEIEFPRNIKIEDFIEANEIWRDDERKKNYIIFAESGDALYVHNLNNNEYEYVDRITLEVIETIPNSKRLFNLILNHILENYD
jgi:hypothetical protein